MPPLVLFHPQTEGLHRGQRIGELWSQNSPAVLASLEEAERESRPPEISEVCVCVMWEFRIGSVPGFAQCFVVCYESTRPNQAI